MNNNASCIYEIKKKYEKSLYFLSQNEKFIETNSDIDNAIYYNNIIRVLFKLKRASEIIQYAEPFWACIDNEMRGIKNDMFKKMNDKEWNKQEVLGKAELLSFLCFNLGLMREKLGYKAFFEIYQKGYEFSVSILGEHHFYTNKFRYLELV